MRILLYTGKGGVGKTSVAAATGLKLSRQGYKTVVISLDSAHSLADAFDLDNDLIRQPDDPVCQIDDRLWMQEINIQKDIKQYWAEIQSYLQTVLNVSGLDEVVAEEVAIFPGMEEVCALLYINQYYRQKSYDVIILDCAPTGESLRFVSIPTVLNWYMKHIFKLERKLAGVARTFVKKISSVPLPKDDYFQNLENLFDQIEGIDEVLANPEITTVRLVTNPEKMVITETQRAFMYFCLYGLTVDAVIINRILPDTVGEPFFNSWKQTQQRYIDEASQYFTNVPIWKIYLLDDEVLGIDGLTRLGDQLYADVDPVAFYRTEKSYQFHKVDDQYQISLLLPFIEKGEVQLAKRAEEVIVQVGGFRQHIPLPRSFMNAEPSSAKLTGDRLVITLADVQSG
ncbi:MAG: TRC40/GET3/ArsA family transport-energizing ATPase [Candidatus Poribacteria bacterium]|nr:TRC40/GET3/ArsA family transport-energizing ATPase [Candidatus Poribacteria bacterium]MDP6749130.1 TRC40/GET3/ArsA family transport-energizing ATPase [Candidatus Poribacteria bacterium]MDP6998876.1 TRC40/GET3/ArsA family transport-energizing ATPase [Candidatus Poribacteria bacterium]